MTVRSILVRGSIAYIPLTRGYTAIIDAGDVGLVENYTWRTLDHGSNIYVMCNTPMKKGKRTVLYLHRTIMGAADGIQIDHISGNGLDNRRANLRFATERENQFNKRIYANNKSGFKGVCWEPRRKKWNVQIQADGKNHWLGYFDDAEEAHAAYCRKAQEIHGKFARAG